MSDILERILVRKRADLEAARAATPLAEIEARAQSSPPPRSRRRCWASILVGEAFMRAPDPGAALRQLFA